MKRLHRWREPRGHRPAAFTLLELLVVIGLIALVTAILLPTITRQREHGSCRVKCGSNLRQIGQAMLMYSNENKGNYPRGIWVPGAPPVFSEDTTNGGTVRDPFAGVGTSAPNDVAVAIWLIVRTQDITTEVFVCPHSNAEKDDFGGGGTPAPGATALNKTSFSNLRKNLSYGFANPYPRTPASPSETPYRWDNTRGAEFALAADVGPGVGGGYDVTSPTTSSGVKEMAKANSRNHQGAGMNVLFGDGHVEFVQNPFVGTQRDHIYTNSSAAGVPTSQKAPVGVDAIPGWEGDSVLLPQW